MEIQFEHMANGLKRATRSYYEISVDELDINQFVLNEGQRLEVIHGNDIMQRTFNTIPLDTFAIWSHINTQCLA